MNTTNKLTRVQVKNLFEKYGYYLTDYILAKAYIALTHLLNNEMVGQDVYSACLDGPSGAGKSFFVDTYCKVAAELLNEEVKYINFQLDAETGKSDLYEDIDVVASLEKNTNKIRIPGKIIEAINLVNNGYFVILKMDEYDKARDATDTFFNNFLQEGLINTIQHGDVSIKPEYKGRLQVLLCKNDQRGNLSEPMMRRNTIFRLDYMTPERLYIILEKFVKDENIDDSLLNFVLSIYENIFNHKELYTKLPSCSECKQAIVDSVILLQDQDFLKRDIYNNIIESMLKVQDDINTFETTLESSTDKSDIKLKNLIVAMKEETEVVENVDLKQMMISHMFESESKELQMKIEEVQTLIDEYRSKFQNLEKQKQALIDKEIERITLGEQHLVLRNDYPNVIRNFEDESLNIKRGYNIFEVHNNDWTDVCDIYMPNLAHHLYIQKLVENVSGLGITIYENGILLRQDNDIKLISINDYDEDGNRRFRIMSSQVIIPATYIKDIRNYISVLEQIYEKQPKTTIQLTTRVLDNVDGCYTFNALIYNDNHLDYDEVKPNIYQVAINGDITSDDFGGIGALADCVVCSNLEQTKKDSKAITLGKRKMLV